MLGGGEVQLSGAGLMSQAAGRSKLWPGPHRIPNVTLAVFLHQAKPIETGGQFESWEQEEMKKLIGLFFAFVVAVPAAAQDTPKTPTADIAGNWDFSFTSPQGAATWRIKFDQAGDTLRGQGQQPTSARSTSPTAGSPAAICPSR